MNVNFYIKDKTKTETAIFAAIRFKGKFYKLFPGVTVETELWDTETKPHRAKELKQYKETAQIINIKLDRFEAKIKKIFEPYILNGGAPALDEIKQALKVEDKPDKPAPREQKKYFTDYFKTYYENAPYKTQTWKKYNTTYNYLKKYEKQFNTRLTFNDINLEFYETFKHWILSKKYTRKKGEAPRNYTINYFGSLVKCIKVVMNETGPTSILKLHSNQEYKTKKFKVTAETADTVYLNIDELMKIHRFKPDYTNIEPICKDPRASQREKKINALNMAKNKFLIGCFTALRVSDFNRLEDVNINAGLITIKPKKGTGKNENVVIPIHPVISEILNSGFNLDAKVSEQKINKHIKEVCALVGINEPVTTARTEGGQVVERTAPKYELITNHTARRSGATNMFLAGIPAISIMKITGHRTESSFLKYIRITQEQNARLLAEHPFFNQH